LHALADVHAFPRGRAPSDRALYTPLSSLSLLHPGLHQHLAFRKTTAALLVGSFRALSSCFIFLKVYTVFVKKNLFEDFAASLMDFGPVEGNKDLGLGFALARRTGQNDGSSRSALHER
jgi:hypothetical protein